MGVEDRAPQILQFLYDLYYNVKWSVYYNLMFAKKWTLQPVLKVVWKSWGLPLTIYPFPLSPLSVPPHSLWAGGTEPLPLL